LAQEAQEAQDLAQEVQEARDLVQEAQEDQGLARVPDHLSDNTKE
jgi:hypothetical protein